MTRAVLKGDILQVAFSRLIADGTIQGMVDQVASELGPINILHNNAAANSDDPDSFFAPFEEYSLDQWRKIMAVNIDGVFLVAQAVGKHMVEKGKGGSIIQTASIYGVMAPDHRIYEGSLYLGRQINTPAVYSASKAAVGAITRCLAVEWAQDGIRVVNVAPGYVETDLNREFLHRDNVRAFLGRRIPTGHTGTPEEVARLVAALFDEALDSMTGETIYIDGGHSIAH